MDQPTAGHPFDTGLDRHPANFVPLSPISFLRRAVSSFRDKIAVIDGEGASATPICMSVACGWPQLWRIAVWGGSIRSRSWRRTFRR